MDLTGDQFDHVHKALLSAFPTEADLALIVQTAMSQNLTAIAIGGSLQEVVLKLVRWTESQGRTAEFMVAAHKKNPGNQELKMITEVLFPELLSSATTLTCLENDANP